MDFNENIPEWSATGTEPSSEIKQSGFQAGYKPPAGYFNWFWNRVSACLTEHREKIKSHAEAKNNPHGVTAEQIGLGNVNNTADADKSVSSANTATTASKVSNSLTLKLNGTTEATFNGSASKTFDVTPSGIGAAPSEHSHAASDVTSGTFSSDRLPTVPIAKGGTGATTAAAALTNLGLTATATELNYCDGVTSNIQKQLDDLASKPSSSAYAVGVTTDGSGSAYTATVDGVTELSVGLSIIIVPHVVSTTTTPTLNVNGLGAKRIRRRLSSSPSSTVAGSSTTWIAANKPIEVVYDGTYWIVDFSQPNAQDIYGTLPIESGGTGATTAAAARTALGIPDMTIVELSGSAFVVNDYDTGFYWLTDSSDIVIKGATSGDQTINFTVGETALLHVVKTSSTTSSGGVSQTSYKWTAREAFTGMYMTVSKGSNGTFSTVIKQPTLETVS